MNSEQCRISLSLGGCKGCEACVSLEPECFEWNEDTERPVLKRDCLDREAAQQLVSYCPKDCISIEDDEQA
ncbi:MAG: ferredoxin [Desulfovibrionaceae bacterium]|jgi:ferredoxin|nr:ferredoxin [Desulfovibrionaceae bacterium]